jgi:hypothetical protein
MDFLVYATIFRLAVVATGSLFMYFGYRLFIHGVLSGQGAEIGGEAGQIKLSLKNAAPGTCFSLFGMILIGLMVWHGSPEMTVSMTSNDGSGLTVKFRGSKIADQEKAFDLVSELQSNISPEIQIKDFASTLTDKDKTLFQASGSLKGLAVAYYRDRRFDEAISMARLVYQYLGDQADTLALIGIIESARSNDDAATKALNRLKEHFPSETELSDAVEMELAK